MFFQTVKMKTTIQLQQEKAVISAKLKLQLSNLQLQQTVVTQLLPKHLLLKQQNLQLKVQQLLLLKRIHQQPQIRMVGLTNGTKRN